MGLILDISPRALERVLYFASYIVLDPADADPKSPKDPGLRKKDIISEAEYRDAREKF